VSGARARTFASSRISEADGGEGVGGDRYGARMSRILALDYGRARAGCAVSDPSGTIATPLPAVERPPTRRGMAALRRLADDLGAELVLVGLPLTLRGDEGEQAAETRAFVERLTEVLAVPVELHDERLTTRQATRSTGQSSSAEDSRAAAHLLESFLASERAAALTE
jgi:putative holliday junction resolvase